MRDMGPLFDRCALFRLLVWKAELFCIILLVLESRGSNKLDKWTDCTLSLGLT